jgi:hypothetical protein
VILYQMVSQELKSCSVWFEIGTSPIFQKGNWIAGDFVPNFIN